MITISKKSVHKLGKKHRHLLKKEMSGQSNTVAIPTAGDDYLTEYAADIDETKSIRRKKKHRVAVTPLQNPQIFEGTAPVKNSEKHNRDEIESPCENRQKKKKIRLSRSLRKLRRVANNPPKSPKPSRSSLAICTKPHLQEDLVAKALPDMNNSLSMISPDMFGSFTHKWPMVANGSPKPSSSTLIRQSSIFPVPANYLSSPFNTNNNDDLVENWEHQPGKIRALTGVNDDTEKEENIAFSSHYIYSRVKSSITISKNTYSIITLAPGSTCNLSTQNGIRICSVARGERVKVRWCTRKVRRTFYIGQDGVWRVRKGEYCGLSNEENGEVVVHAFDCKSEE
ncbi:hypothetical protein BGZ60DRAFT_422002 [Tricladium varicosporioides]|nr:hypothetical protein BGZ60DRAFT_422002 [Hymenoscyphus varicosporioides]